MPNTARMTTPPIAPPIAPPEVKELDVEAGPVGVGVLELLVLVGPATVAVVRVESGPEMTKS